jgi:predicted kinase
MICKKLLVLTVGLPQSGKSTWAKESGHPIVNRDAIRKTLGGTIRYFKEEKRVSEIERLMVESLFNAGHDTVVVDATNLRPVYRKSWEKFAKELSDVKIYLRHFYTSMEVCIQRAKRNFPDEPRFPTVIRGMWESATLDAGNIPEKQIKFGD